jgi:phospholipid transport system substrate-binding protein
MLAVAVPLPSRSAVAQDAVNQPVLRLHAALLAAAPGESLAERRARLAPVVADVFDYATMSRAAVGSIWAELDAAARARLIDRFADYATANYAARFDNPENLTFEIVATRPADGGRTWVETRLLRPAEEPVRFDYLVQPTDAGWKIVNVVVDGTLNELARRRAEFRALLAEGGFDHLMTTLERQTEAAGG